MQIQPIKKNLLKTHALHCVSFLHALLCKTTHGFFYSSVFTIQHKTLQSVLCNFFAMLCVQYIIFRCALLFHCFTLTYLPCVINTIQSTLFFYCSIVPFYNGQRYNLERISHGSYICQKLNTKTCQLKHTTNTHKKTSRAVKKT